MPALRRNPFGAQALFGYEDDYQPKPGPEFLGFNTAAGVGSPELTPIQQEQPELITPIDAAEVGANEGGGGDVAQSGPTGDIVTDAMIEQRRRLAKALMGNQQEVNHPLQAIGNAVSQITGAWMESKAARDEQKRETARRDQLKSALGQGGDINALADRLMQSTDPDLVDKGLELKTQAFKASQRGSGKPMQMIKGDQYVYVDEETGREIPGYGGPRYRDRAEGGGAGGGGHRQKGGAFQLPTGEIVAAQFNPADGDYYFKDKNGQIVPIPSEARPVTPSTGGSQSPAQWLKLKKDRREGINALEAIDAYAKQAGGLKQGYRRWGTEISAKWRTFLGNQGLTQDQFDQLQAPAKQQALLGMLRTTIVGPGVMTEYDAERIVQAMGGDPRSAMQNPEVMAAILEDLYNRKRREVDVLQSEYERNAPTFGEEPEPLPAPRSFGPQGQTAGPRKPARDPNNPYKPGDIVKGYRFKGGDWRDKRNYEKVAP